MMTQTAEQPTDLPLVEAVRRGDPDAFGEFVRRNERWVRGVILGVTGRSDLVHDVAQDVWERAWRHAGTLRDTQKWRPWLYKLARRAAIDAGKRRRATADREAAADETLDRTPAAEPTPDQQLVDDEQRARMTEAIRSLPPHYREPFVLKHVEGWSYAQIGQVLGLPEPTVETRLVRARRMLRETLQNVT